MPFDVFWGKPHLGRGWGRLQEGAKLSATWKRDEIYLSVGQEHKEYSLFETRNKKHKKMECPFFGAKKPNNIIFFFGGGVRTKRYAFGNQRVFPCLGLVSQHSLHVEPSAIVQRNILIPRASENMLVDLDEFSCSKCSQPSNQCKKHKRSQRLFQKEIHLHPTYLDIFRPF